MAFKFVLKFKPKRIRQVKHDTHKTCQKSSKEKTTKGNKGMDGGKILMYTLNKQAGEKASGMNWLSTGDNNGFFFFLVRMSLDFLVLQGISVAVNINCSRKTKYHSVCQNHVKSWGRE